MHMRSHRPEPLHKDLVVYAGAVVHFLLRILKTDLLKFRRQEVEHRTIGVGGQPATGQVAGDIRKAAAAPARREAVFDVGITSESMLAWEYIHQLGGIAHAVGIGVIL